MKSVGEVFMMLLHSVTNAHILHLQSKSYSEHMALGAFYSELGDLVDTVIESYQGKYGVIVRYPNMYQTPAVTAMDELNRLSKFVVDNRSIIGNDSELQNEMDNIQTLINSTIYKLKFLK